MKRLLYVLLLLIPGITVAQKPTVTVTKEHISVILQTASAQKNLYLFPKDNCSSFIYISTAPISSFSSEAPTIKLMLSAGLKKTASKLCSVLIGLSENSYTDLYRQSIDIFANSKEWKKYMSKPNAFYDFNSSILYDNTVVTNIISTSGLLKPLDKMFRSMGYTIAKVQLPADQQAMVSRDILERYHKDASLHIPQLNAMQIDLAPVN